MKLIAAVIVRNELSRYLEPCVSSLLEYVDEVRILDDGSTDGWQEACQGAWGKAGARVVAKTGSTRDDGSVAFNHHAAARNQLLQWTLDGWPTHILQIDADEMVSDGRFLRRACELPGDAWTLSIEEVWEACNDQLCVREDGGWRSHAITLLWKPDMARRSSYLIADNGHATARIPSEVWRWRQQDTGVSLLHFGWANRKERAERFRRYQQGDGGRFHAADHIESIMAPDSQVVCRAREWPTALEPWREEMLARANR